MNINCASTPLVFIFLKILKIMASLNLPMAKNQLNVGWHQNPDKKNLVLFDYNSHIQFLPTTNILVTRHRKLNY